jgi:hypothetical protein
LFDYSYNVGFAVLDYNKVGQLGLATDRKMLVLFCLTSVRKIGLLFLTTYPA